MIFKCLVSALTVGVLSACASSYEPVIIRNPASRDLKAAPKVDVNDAAYIEVVRGGFEMGERYSISIPKTGNSTFSYLQGTQIATSQDLSPGATKEVLKEIQAYDLVEPTDVLIDHVGVMDGTQEYLYLRTDSDLRYLMRQSNAPDDNFNRLWKLLEQTSRTLIGTFNTTKDEHLTFGTSDELEGYLKEVWSQRYPEAGGE